MNKLKVLQSLKGSKVHWTGFDEESDSYLLLLENGTCLSITEFEVLEDFRTYAGNLLDSNLEMAESIIELKSILLPNKEKQSKKDKAAKQQEESQSE